VVTSRESVFKRHLLRKCVLYKRGKVRGKVVAATKVFAIKSSVSIFFFCLIKAVFACNKTGVESDIVRSINTCLTTSRNRKERYSTIDSDYGRKRRVRTNVGVYSLETV